MYGKLFLTFVGLVQGEDGIFQIGCRISVYVLLAFHGSNHHSMSRHQLLLVVFGRGLDALGHEIVGDRSLYTRGVRFLGRYPPTQLVTGQGVGFSRKFSDQFTGFFNGCLILKHLFEAVLVGEDSTGNLTMPEGRDSGEISDASQEEWKRVFHNLVSLDGAG